MTEISQEAKEARELAHEFIGLARERNKDERAAIFCFMYAISIILGHSSSVEQLNNNLEVVKQTLDALTRVIWANREGAAKNDPPTDLAVGQNAAPSQNAAGGQP